MEPATHSAPRSHSRPKHLKIVPGLLPGTLFFLHCSSEVFHSDLAGHVIHVKDNGVCDSANDNCCDDERNLGCLVLNIGNIP